MHEHHRTCGRLLAPLTLLLLSPLAAAQTGIGAQEVCAASLELSTSPNFNATAYTLTVGYDGGTAYDEQDLLIPEPLPIGVFLNDVDEYFLRCTNDCRPFVTTYGTDVYWEVVGSGKGAFVDANGLRQSTMGPCDQVVYVPPRRLADGETRTATIIAYAYDTVPDDDLRDDGYVWFEFTATVTRHPASPGPSDFDVRVELTGTGHSGDVDDPVDCTFEPGCCTFSGDPREEGPSIQASIDAYPVFGVLAWEPRPITLSASDYDLVYTECGVPPCQHTYSGGLLYDTVDIAWSIKSGPGMLHMESSGGTADTVIFEGTGAGKVTVEAIISSDLDPSVTLEKTFFVYDATLIDGLNGDVDPLPFRRHGQASDGKEGVSISRVPTGTQMNGCGSVTPTFDGPPTADPHTYRLHVDLAPEVPPSETFGAVFSISSPYGPSPYSEVFDTLRVGDQIRTDKHVRLVSNGVPQGEPIVLGPHVYDDEVCPEQTALCIPGDWFEVKLLVGGGQLVGTLELPVGRSWSEPDEHGINDPKTLLLAPIAWLVSTASPQFPGSVAANTLQANWGQAVLWYATRASEDFASVGVEFESVDLDLVPPSDNVVRIQRQQVGVPFSAATIEITFDNPVWPIVQIQTPATNSIQLIGELIAQGVDAQTGRPCLSTLLYEDYDDKWVVVLGMQDPLDIRAITVTPGSNMLLSKLPQSWASGAPRTREEQFAFVATWKELAFGQPTKAVIAVIEGGLLEFPQGTAAGVTYPQSGAPGLAGSIVLTNLFAKGSDSLLPQLVGHELTHFCQDAAHADHVMDKNNFIDDTTTPPPYEYPDTTAANPNPDDVSAKRHNDSQALWIRTDHPLLYTRPFLPIPERRY